MRRLIIAAIGSLLLVAAAPVRAEPAQSGADSQGEPCAAGAKALGVSRIVEIDTKHAPMFGRLQYRTFDFLKDGEVVLTFDDGPSRRHTEAVLKALDRHCTKGTFFMVGRMAIADPVMAREVAQRGHTVGVHTWSHKNLNAIGAAKAKAEFELGLSAVSKVVGSPVVPFFRFPYLRDSKAMIGYLRERDVASFSIDVDSYDFKTKTPSVVQKNVLAQLATKRKGIILFHDIQPSTAGALSDLLDELQKHGFKIVHLVSTSRVTTLPEYDAIAEKALAHKNLAALQNPLAVRSVVWPVTPTRDTISAKPAEGGADDGVIEVLPWQKPTSAEGQPAPDSEAPSEGGQPEWFRQLFGN
jgi:peptidoglycan/xylan/chitin deacetylase (PgdA/CDA1 family)